MTPHVCPGAIFRGIGVRGQYLGLVQVFLDYTFLLVKSPVFADRTYFDAYPARITALFNQLNVLIDAQIDIKIPSYLVIACFERIFWTAFDTSLALNAVILFHYRLAFQLSRGQH